ncbi:MAG: replication initiation factor domain-containing protein [Planctomycetota bacterium]
MTGPRHLLPKIMDLLANYFGELTEGSVGGKYRRAYRIGDASGVMYDGGPKNLRDRLKVQLTGAILGEMEPQAIRQLCHELYFMGMKVTRLDVAIDLYKFSDLIKSVLDAIERGELVHAQKHKLVDESLKQVPCGSGVFIGSRGPKGSGRYVRVYDKGLESRSAPPREWVRWEAEFAFTVGDDVMRDWLLSADYPAAAKFLLARCWGAIDFRQPASRQLSRRARSSWFESLVNSVEPVLIRKLRVRSTLEGQKAWIRSILPKLELSSRELGLSLVQLLDHLGEGRPQADHRALNTDVFRQLEAELAEVSPFQAVSG